MPVACYIHTSGTCGCSILVTGCRRLPQFPKFLDTPSASTCNNVFTLATRCCRHAIANRSLLLSGNTTIFSNGWAQGWGWWASGARNISEVPGVGVNQESGLHHISKPWGKRAVHTPAWGGCTCLAVVLQASKTLPGNVCQMHRLKPHVVMFCACNCL